MSLSTCSKLESEVDGLMRVVRSTDESVVVVRIRTGAMVALLFGMLVCFGVVYESEERSAEARGVLFGFMN